MIAESRGKWVHELDDLDVDEYSRLLAFYTARAKEAEADR